MLLISLIPLLIQVLLNVLLIHAGWMQFLVNLCIILITPILLSVYNFNDLVETRSVKRLFIYLYMIMVSVMEVLIVYVAWAIGTGSSLGYPDSETMMLMGLYVQYSIIAYVVSWIVVLITRRKRGRA